MKPAIETRRPGLRRRATWAAVALVTAAAGSFAVAEKRNAPAPHSAPVTLAEQPRSAAGLDTAHVAEPPPGGRSAPRQPATPQPVAPSAAARAGQSDFDSPSCEGLELASAVEAEPGVEALVQIVANGHASRQLRLGEELNGQLLTFVGSHPQSGELTVVLEGERGPCRVPLQSETVAMHRTDQEARLSVGNGGDAARARAAARFAVAGEARGEPAKTDDFVRAAAPAP
jgi:hypothetical protein